MTHISSEELIEFVRARGELQLQTLHKKHPFTVHATEDGIEYLPQTDKPRPHERKYIDRVCEEFSRTNSFSPDDYAEITMNASYTLALIRAYFDSQRTTRKQFVESHGATCTNWNFSWSFINESKRMIIFGAWDAFTQDRRAMIFSEDWRVNARGRKSKGYNQSREHIRLIEEDGYRLMTFPMQYSEDEEGTAKIKGITPVLTEKVLTRVGRSWYASDPRATSTSPLPEELVTPEKYSEGARFSVTINAYERNPKARAACIAHHGHICAVCGFDFVKVYGSLGDGFIHVHHIVPIGKIGAEYEIDPIADLTPVCPNCHAMIHRTEPPLTVEQLRNHIHK